MRVRLSCNDGGVDADLIKVFDRDTLREAEDGEVHTMRSWISLAFRTIPRATRAALLTTARGGTPLVIVEVAHLWFDVGGTQVTIAKLGDGPATLIPEMA